MFNFGKNRIVLKKEKRMSSPISGEDIHLKGNN